MGPAKDNMEFAKIAKVTFLFAKNGRLRTKEFHQPPYVTHIYHHISIMHIRETHVLYMYKHKSNRQPVLHGHFVTSFKY